MAIVEHAAELPVTTARQVRVAGDGSRITFLRSPAPELPTQLWAYDVTTAREQLVADPRRLIDTAGGITSYATDAAAQVTVFALAGQIFHVELGTGEVTEVPSQFPAVDPRLDPTGQWVGYRTGADLRIVGATGDQGDDTLLAGEPEPRWHGQRCISWGCAGWWWAPDGRSVLAARTDHRSPQRRVSLHLLDLDGGWVDVHWDRETYPYLASVYWRDQGSPVVAVLRSCQQHGLVLVVDRRTGETQVHAELTDPHWVTPVAGTPQRLSDGRMLIGGELAHDDYDARCLFADGVLLTPPSLYVRRVVGRLPGVPKLLVEASADDPSQQHLYQVSTCVNSTGINAQAVTSQPGWHYAELGSDTLALGSQSLAHTGARWTVWRRGSQIGEFATGAAPGTGPQPVLQQVTDRQLPAGVVYPAGHIPGHRLPVLVDLAGGLTQRVRATQGMWLVRRRWAEAGFAVVVLDHRGTPGVAPSFEKVVHRRMADLALADLVEGLEALVKTHTDLDLSRVAVRGYQVGGWLAALACLHRPDVFRCAAAWDPLVDWTDADPMLAARYLGSAADDEVYQRHCLVTAAGQTTTCAPLLLVHTAATDAQVGRLAAAMKAAGLPHTVVAATEQTAATEREFLRHYR